MLCGFVSAPLSSLAVLPGAPAVSLAWDPSTDSTVVGYNVYYGTASRTYTNVIAAGNSTNAVVSNLVSGVTYYFAATTYTAVGMESDYSAEAFYAVPPPNVPPTINPLPDITIPQDSGKVVVQLTGITCGATNENQSLSVSAFSSNPGLIPAPTVNYTSPETNGTLTFTPTPGSFGSSVITILVDDGGAVSNTVIVTFAVMVAPTENPPTIDPIKSFAINENSGMQTVALTGITDGTTNSSQALMVTAVSSNPSLIPNPTVNYSTPSTTGSLNFTPATNGFGSAIITVTVTDAQPTNNTTMGSFVVTVNQAVVGPGVLTNFVIAPNSILRYIVPTPATNGDKFTVSLGSGAPAGVKLSSRKGQSWLVWTPTSSQASTTNSIGIKIIDSVNSSLSTNEVVLVVVEDYLGLTLGSTSIQSGQSGSVPIALSSSEGVTNLSFTVPWPGSALTSPALSISASGVASSSLKAQGSNLLVNVQMNAGQVLTGSNIIGSINFQCSASQSSGYLSLPIANVTAYKPNSAPYQNWFPTAGQVAVINGVAMLQANSDTGRTLTILGKVGSTYQVQYCTNVGATSVWYPLVTISQTNVTQTITVDPTLPVALYRVQQK